MIGIQKRSWLYKCPRLYDGCVFKARLSHDFEGVERGEVVLCRLLGWDGDSAFLELPLRTETTIRETWIVIARGVRDGALSVLGREKQ